ncbi:nucleotidyltransferase [bacterium]|nr:nucleotidyltransferase [bacterium]
MNKQGVIDTLKAQEKEIRQMGVQSLALFGSVARDEPAANSDIDLRVEFQPDTQVGLFQFIELQQYLENLLGVEKVDLVTRHTVIEEIKEDIYSEAVNVL